ncbi:MAG TPA: 1-deoxy-D-xylulose-5-phosphate reductoisomerase [Acidimicrobiaceae bacterium]|jgi:1-deoxy-D-xylulose-5-phosphate reductoisomerase|nr:1-deoxy-D-xylulose-5-phosphate reductoisomerase [Acidimicrobiaceae bacterium]MDP7258639.1 1-deoxy-D-xylulose-5-phosphate reductoisomerase [Acidimicrobiales bacterium]HCV35554.1 1-deoxy-D-xylulose-5-phosphate reductoisomerase [Acidimicrobiaceae bacterium]HJO79225.1 1-deoxy-D-xylulose-5-phosphate reductoisomerase [Acidimicrobiales bacterium]|tara:strand:- start:5677 stop:6834 length:1158 start_codon:yes stop_codon:yes gene_type:complete
MSVTTVAVLGSTGSIGRQALEIVAARPDDFEVVVLGAARSVDLLVEQATAFRPEMVAVADAGAAADVAGRIPTGIEVISGSDSLAKAAVTADVAINGVVGFAGLPVTLAVLNAGKRLGLANKESLIAAGPIVRRARQTRGAELLPVDSEHCAIHQCLRSNENQDRVSRIVLTASGGPFRGHSRSELESVTVEDALNHPTWSMGPKITVDSSTLMNKGLEVIEAHELFDVGYDDIDVVVHPQSIVHSMVTFTDGATIAQLSLPDMRLCVGYALAYPDRLGVPFGEIDWAGLDRLDFEMPDRGAFPCMDLAYAAGRLGETAPAWLSAANEVAVGSFLAGDLAWIEIADVLAEALNSWPGEVADSIEAVLDIDRRSRETTAALIARAR